MATVSAASWELLASLTRREVKARYSQSLIGAAWAVVQPVVMMVVFTLVFSGLAKVPSDGVPYALFAYAALVPWVFFANAVTSGTGSLVNYRTIVTKTYFPREVIPLAQVTSRMVDFGAAALVFGALMVYYGVRPTGWLLLLPLIFAVQVLFTSAVALAAAAFNVFFRDVGPIMQLGLQVWLYVTPVAYPLSVVPEHLRGWLMLNPLTGLIGAYRAVVVYGRAPEWDSLGIATMVTVVAVVGAYVVFKRLDRYFADVI